MSDRKADTTPVDTVGALPRDVVRVLDWSRGHLHEPVGLCALARSPERRRARSRRTSLFLGATPLGWVRQAD